MGQDTATAIDQVDEERLHIVETVAEFLKEERVDILENATDVLGVNKIMELSTMATEQPLTSSQEISWRNFIQRVIPGTQTRIAGATPGYL